MSDDFIRRPELETLWSVKDTWGHRRQYILGIVFYNRFDKKKKKTYQVKWS